MKRLFSMLLGLVAALAILSGGLAPQAHAEGKFGKYKVEQAVTQTQEDSQAKYKITPVSDDTEAKKALPPSWVADIAGEPVKVRFVGTPAKYKFLVETARGKAENRAWNTYDGNYPATIWSYSKTGHARCIHFKGPDHADGWFVIPDKWETGDKPLKVITKYVASSTKWYPRNQKQCENRPEWRNN